MPIRLNQAIGTRLRIRYKRSGSIEYLGDTERDVRELEREERRWKVERERRHAERQAEAAEGKPDEEAMREYWKSANLPEGWDAER